MSHKHFLAVIALSVLFVSCSFLSQKLFPEKWTVSGPLSSYIKVVQKEYKVTDGKIHVDFRRKNNEPADYLENPALYIELLDKDGNILEKSKTSGSLQRTELEALLSLDEGDCASVEFNVENRKAVKFRIISMARELPKPTPIEVNTPSSVIVTGDLVRLRQGPSLNCDPYIDPTTGLNLHVNTGDRLYYVGETSDFYAVSCYGVTAYVSKLYTVPSYDKISPYDCVGL